MGTPWSKTALRDVSFTVNEGDGVLIHGGNGSGKSTLAWIMAGLTRPTSGRCLVRGRPAHESVGEVAIAFQAARLQLLRSRVDLEVASAAGFRSTTPNGWFRRWRRSVSTGPWLAAGLTNSAAARCVGW